MNNKITEAYLSEALKNCPFGFRKRLKSDLYSSLCDFAEEKPSFNESELLFRFGAPQQYAAEYIASLDDKSKADLINSGKFIKSVIIIALAVIAVFVAVTVVFTVASRMYEGPVYIL